MSLLACVQKVTLMLSNADDEISTVGSVLQSLWCGMCHHLPSFSPALSLTPSFPYSLSPPHPQLSPHPSHHRAPAAGHQRVRAAGRDAAGAGAPRLGVHHPTARPGWYPATVAENGGVPVFMPKWASTHPLSFFRVHTPKTHSCTTPWATLHPTHVTPGRCAVQRRPGGPLPRSHQDG